MPDKCIQLKLDVPIETTRRCTQCGVDKPLEAFPINKRVKCDGRASKCKACVAEYHKARYYADVETSRAISRERARRLYRQDRVGGAAKARAWRERNADHYRVYRAQYDEAHKDHIRARNHQWYRANHEHALAVRKTYRDTHRAQCQLRSKEWRTRNKDRTAETARAWLARNKHRQRETARAYYHKRHDRIIARKRAYREANRDQFRAWSRESQRRRRVNRTPESVAYIALLQRDPCSYCGQRKPIAIDHIVPVSRGGGSEPDNLTAACAQCNGLKSNRPLLEFLLILGRADRKAA